MATDFSPIQNIAREYFHGVIPDHPFCVVSEENKEGPINITLIIKIRIFGGRGGIRTHVRIAPKPDFESGAFNHSATLPHVYLQALTKQITMQT